MREFRTRRVARLTLLMAMLLLRAGGVAAMDFSGADTAEKEAPLRVLVRPEPVAPVDRFRDAWVAGPDLQVLPFDAWIRAHNMGEAEELTAAQIRAVALGDVGWRLTGRLTPETALGRDVGMIVGKRYQGLSTFELASLFDVEPINVPTREGMSSARGGYGLLDPMLTDDPLSAAFGITCFLCGPPIMDRLLDDRRDVDGVGGGAANGE